MSAPFVTVDELKRQLSPLLDEQEEGAVVFDADGTLWSHDVGCMVFDEAVEQGAFREESLVPLLAEARTQGIPAAGTSANDVARSLQKAWHERNYDEKSAAEMQVWAYVGFSEEEFRSFSRAALHQGAHLSTLHEEVLALAEWVRGFGKRACIVSASPLWVLEEATRDLGFGPLDIAAGVPQTEAVDGEVRIRAGLEKPLPYGPDKVLAGRALLGESAWIAALGDSGFDLHMMAEARVGVGIGNKPKMLRGLAAMSHTVRLVLTPTGLALGDADTRAPR